jgi:hypothetical protein
MPQNLSTISRTAWDDVRATFREFFAGVGEVTVTDESVVFSAPDTSLSLGRDGRSRSFMPLHDLAARWDEVTFDHDAMEVRVASADAQYVYRVPPRLIPSR